MSFKTGFVCSIYIMFMMMYTQFVIHNYSVHVPMPRFPRSFSSSSSWNIPLTIPISQHTTLLPTTYHPVTYRCQDFHAASAVPPREIFSSSFPYPNIRPCYLPMPRYPRSFSSFSSWNIPLTIPISQHTTLLPTTYHPVTYRCQDFHAASAVPPREIFSSPFPYPNIPS